MLGAVGPLTDPTAHGGRPEDAFDLVLPSIPGYGFSAEPTELGWYAGRVAQAWPELMHRLGYTRYVAQGGDVGAAITDAMGRLAPEGLVGIHTNLLAPALGGAAKPEETEEEREAADALRTFRATGFGYFLEQSTRPQTIGYALLDLPWPWRRGCSTTIRTATTRSRAPSSTGSRRETSPGTTPRQRHAVLVHRYRSFCGPVVLGERAGRGASSGETPPAVSLPVGFTPSRARSSGPRSWVEKAYPTLVYYNEVDKGGHFAAWEEPELFSSELRAAFKSVR